MWFDAQAALGNLGDNAAPPSAPALPDKRETQLAGIAEIAVSEASAPETPPSATPHPMALTHGKSVGGRPLTYTGRVVSLGAWRSLSNWERHGPRGRIWDGVAKQWRQVESETE